MRRGIVYIVMLGMALALWASPRTSTEALRIADAFREGMQTVGGKPSRVPAGPSSLADSTGIYYAVNTHSGYVIVGADDRLPEVLGYSDEGVFEPDNMAPALRFWLQCYGEETGAMEQGTGSYVSARVSGTPQRAVEPLMTTKWNQSAPYNNFAPLYNETGGRSVTGCVATAMAQIMRYHRYPQTGTGSHSYYWIATTPAGKSGTLSANFGQTVYDWANMSDSYKSGYTTAQADAVATLMYHCGVAVEMNYGSSSGAFSADVPKALAAYFGYDTNYQKIQKAMYPADSLKAIIAAELRADRPVLVSGSNDEGGHAFVCDGYDGQGYFHINWGWGGSNDGYYLLTALNPGKSQGIGGTSKGYNQATAFFIGLQPANSSAQPAIPQMATTSFSLSSESFKRTASFSVSISRLQNYGLTDFSGNYGVALYDEDETEMKALLGSSGTDSLRAGYFRTTEAVLSNLKIPGTLEAGTYHLCAVYKDAHYGWMRMMCTQDDYYRTVTLTSSDATFYPNDAESVLSLEAPISFGEGVNTDSVPFSGAPLSFKVKNTGGTFRGEISARIYKGAFSKGQYEVAPEVVIRRNEILSSALQQSFDSNLLLATQYKMKLCWRANANDSWHDFEPAEYAVLPFMLYDPYYHLALTDTIRFENNDSVPRRNAKLYYSVKNTGAPFEGELQLSFYEGVFSRGKSDIQEVRIGTNETLSGTFEGQLEQPAGTYTVVLRYREKEGEWQEFIDKNMVNIGAVVATVVDESPTGVYNPASERPSESMRVMSFGAYDLYIITMPDGRYKKVFIPHNR